LLADTPDGAARRNRMDQVFALAPSETGCQDMDLGFTYDSAAVVDDATPPAPRDPAAVRYTPSTRPGSRLPHVWLRRNGKALSTHDLIPMGGFLLLTGSAGASWCAAAQRVAAETGVTLRAVRIGDENSDIADPSRMWGTVSGIATDGAILIRPDGHVAFRAGTAVENSVEALCSALSQILARSISAASFRAG